MNDICEFCKGKKGNPETIEPNFPVGTEACPECRGTGQAFRPDLSMRLVVCAANRRRKDFRIVCGPRHWDATMRSQIPPRDKGSLYNWDQGFIDQFGIWMTREEAYEVAERNNQIRHVISHARGYLFSENLY